MMNELICAKLKEFRLNKGCTQGDLAALLSTTRQRYARMENGQADLSLSDLEKLASFYEIPLKELTGLMDRTKSFEELLQQAMGEKPDKDTFTFCQLMLRLREEEDIYYSKKTPHNSGKENQNPLVKRILESDQRSGMEEDFFLYPLGNGLCGLTIADFFGQREKVLVINSYLSLEDRRFTKEILCLIEEQSSFTADRVEILRQDGLERLKSSTEICEKVRRRLIPIGELYQKIDSWFGIDPEELRILQLISLAEEFGVSTAYMIETLCFYRIISQDRKKGLEKGLRYYTEERLRMMLGIRYDNSKKETCRSKDGADVRKVIPYYYIDHLLYNFEKGYIPFGLFSKVMKLCDINVDSLKSLRKPMDDRDGWDDWD